MSYYKACKGKRETMILNNFMDGYDTVWDDKNKMYIKEPLPEGPNKRSLSFIRAFTDLRTRFNIGISLNNLFVYLLVDAGDETRTLTSNMYRIAAAQAKTANLYRGIISVLKRHGIKKDTKTDKWLLESIRKDTERINRNMHFLDIWAKDYGLDPVLEAIKKETGFSMKELAEEFNENYYIDHPFREETEQEKYFEKRDALFCSKINEIAEKHGINIKQLVMDAIAAENELKKQHAEQIRSEQHAQKTAEIEERAKILNDRKNADLFHAVDNSSDSVLSVSNTDRLRRNLICAGGSGYYFTFTPTGKRLQYLTENMTWAETPYSLLLIPENDKDRIKEVMIQAKKSVEKSSYAVVSCCRLSFPPDHYLMKNRNGQSSAVENLIAAQRHDLTKILENGFDINFYLCMLLYENLKRHNGTIWYGCLVEKDKGMPVLKYLSMQPGNTIICSDCASEIRLFGTKEECAIFYEKRKSQIRDEGSFVAVDFHYDIPNGFYDRLVKNMAGNVIEDCLGDICRLITHINHLDKKDESGQIKSPIGWSGMLFADNLLKHISPWSGSITFRQMRDLTDAVRQSEHGIRIIIKLGTKVSDVSNHVPPLFLNVTHYTTTVNVTKTIEHTKDVLALKEKENDDEHTMTYIKMHTGFSDKKRFCCIYAELGDEKQCRVMDELYCSKMHASGKTKIYQFADIWYDKNTEQFMFRNYAPEHLVW